VPIAPPRNPIRHEEARAALAAANYDLVTTKETPVVVAAARFDDEHRLGDLVRAWRIVSATRSDARLWILGDGPARDRLYRQIGDLDLRFRVLLPGTFDSSQEVLQAADLLVVPAAHTVPPIAMLEAMAAGLPVIAADAPGIREAVEPELTGLIFPAGEVKALAAALLRLIENPAEGVRLGSAAREQMRTAPEVAAEATQYIALFRRLHESRARAGEEG
jgi:glycosyltransferase involved in cell wall biosynthesis